MTLWERRHGLVDLGENPLRIPDVDPLLEKLKEHHGERRYELTGEGGNPEDNLPPILGDRP
jgi:hypothetical protein